MHERAVSREPENLSPDYQVIAEKVEKYSDQDAVIVDVIDGKPLITVGDGIGSLDDSGPFANWLTGKAHELVKNLVRQNLTVEILRTEIANLIATLNSESNDIIKQKKWEAGSTLLITFLYKPVNAQTQWFTVGVGNGSILFFHRNENGEVIFRDHSPGQVDQNNATNAFPYHPDMGPKFSSEVWSDDHVLVASDGLDLLLGNLRRSFPAYWQEFLLFLAQNAVTMNGVAESFSAKKVTALWAEFANNHKPPIDGKLEQYYGAGDDLTVAAAAPLQ